MTEQDGPILNIIGEKVALGPHRRDLLPLYTRWLNDFEVVRNLAMGMHPMTLDAEGEWYERAKMDPHTFLIYAREPLRPIGGTGLHEVNHKHRTAEFGIFLGEKDFWGKGYGTEATRLMLDYAFTGLGLHNVLLRVYSYNVRAQRAYSRAGFREFGRRREAIRIGGRAYDIVYMDCLATEFESPALHRLLPADP